MTDLVAVPGGVRVRRHVADNTFRLTAVAFDGTVTSDIDAADAGACGDMASRTACPSCASDADCEQSSWFCDDTPGPTHPLPWGSCRRWGDAGDACAKPSACFDSCISGFCCGGMYPCCVTSSDCKKGWQCTLSNCHL